MTMDELQNALEREAELKAYVQELEGFIMAIYNPLMKSNTMSGGSQLSAGFDMVAKIKERHNGTQA